MILIGKFHIARMASMLQFLNYYNRLLRVRIVRLDTEVEKKI